MRSNLATGENAPNEGEFSERIKKIDNSLVTAILAHQLGFLVTPPE